MKPAYMEAAEELHSKNVSRKITEKAKWWVIVAHQHFSSTVQRFLIQLGILQRENLLCIIGGLEKRQIVADCQRENQGDVNHFQWE